MNAKRLWTEWRWTTAAFAVCGAGLLLNLRAWQVGYSANAIGLLGCNFLRCLLLLLAGVTAVGLFKPVVAKHKPPGATGISVLEVACMTLIFTGCLGCYPLWPVVLVLLTVPVLGGLIFSRKDAARPAADRPARIPILPAAVGVLLFTLTWYLCASTSRQALRGLGARLEARAGADKLLAWAAEMINARKPEQPPPRLEREEIPGWVDDLLGPFQGIRSAGVEDYGGDSCVALFTGGSAYHFRITICPSRIGHAPPPRWAGEDAGQWRPGIYLSTEGK